MSEISTGELRSRLQPVIFIQLLEDIPPLQARDVVAAQYWGQGRVTLTRVLDGVRAVNVAHSIKAVEPVIAPLFEAHDDGVI